MIAPGQSAMGGGLLGVLSPGEKRLTGKSFYLDNVKRRPAALLVEAIVHLGGKVESFLHKDVTFLVTGSQEALPEGIRPIKIGANEGRGETQPPRDGVQDTKERPWPTTPRPARPTCFGSRGMALLEKAIRNNERLQGSSVLQNARSWGVQILYVNDILLFLQRLTRESFITKQKKPEQKNCSKVAVGVVKAACLKSPYLKVEDISRKYKPLYVQSLSFPSFCSLGSFGPSEPIPPPCPEKHQEPDQEKNKDSHKLASGPLGIPYPPPALKPSPWRAMNKVQGYCECCLEAFNNQEEHIVSAKHRRFLQDDSNYRALDQLVASLLPGFDPNPPQHTDPSLDSLPTSTRPPTPEAADLVTLSDAETEKAVSALLNPLSTFDEAFKGLHHAPCPSAATRPATANPAPHPPSAPILAALLAAPRPPSPCTWLWSPDPPTLTPCSPVRQPPKLEPLSPLPPVSEQPSDPYSQPPVLSAVALGSHNENLVLYSDPPELSPEIPILFHPTLSDTEACCPEMNPQRCIGGAAQTLCAKFSPGRSPPLAPFRSSSPPRMSRTMSKSRKRSRSASPRAGSTKRTRLAYSPDQQFLSKPQNDTEDLTVLSQITPAWTNADFTMTQTCMESDPTRNFSSGPVPPEGAKDATKPTFTMFVVPETKPFSEPPGCLTTGHSGLGDGQPPSPISLNTPDCSFSIHSPIGFHNAKSSQCSLPHSLASLCIESALLRDVAGVTLSSSELDWDHELLSRLGPATATTPTNPLPASRGRCGLDQELLQRHCTWTHNSSYEARLHSALQPTTTSSSRVL